MHEWIQMDRIKPGGTAGVILELQLLSLQIYCMGRGLFVLPGFRNGKEKCIMKLENYEVHLPNYSIGDRIYDKIGPVCESYRKKVLVIVGRIAFDAAYVKSCYYVEITDLQSF